MTNRSNGSLARPSRRITLAGFALAAIVGVPVGVAVQTPRKPPVKTGEVVRLGPGDARESADKIRKASSIQLAPGLEMTVWATEELVADALAIDIDANGVAYVGSTPRGSQWLDTRQHPDWVPEIQRLKTTEDLRQFFRQKMATELSDKNTWITDFNKDGVRDFRDLMGVPERIFRIEDTNGDGVADTSTVVFEGFNQDIAADILGGVMVHSSGDVYATIAPDLWRLRDTNGDKILDWKESISHGYSVHPSFSGHDMSALTQGPDGMIYWKIGEIGMNVVDKTGRRWAHPHTGAVLRSNPDGTDFEVYAYGVRNPQEIAFDDFGNLISADNDGDYPGETERIIYIAEGSDTGWRSTWQFGKFTDANNNRYNPWIDEGMFKVRFAEQASYITPPIAPFSAGPSGFAYNPGTALDPAWKNHFFVTSYTGSPANARTFGFTLNARGAGFELGVMKQMVQGVLAPGMKIGPDGAIYLTDWVRGWSPTGEGRVWKLDSVAGKRSPIRTAVHALLKENFTSRPVPRMVELLQHEDQRVRLKAQFELVRRGDHAALTGAATSSREGQLSRVHAIWGLGQLLRSRAVPGDALTAFLTDADPEIRAQAAKVLGHARTVTAAAALVPLVQDANPRVRYFATVALGRLGHRAAMPAVVTMLAADQEQDVYLRSAAVVALAGFGDRAGLASLATHASRGVRLAAVVALRRLQDAGVARFLDDADPLVVTEAAGAINDEGGIVAALPALARVLDRTGITGQPLVRRAISANLRVGDAAAVARVAAYARRAGLPDPLRIEAISTMGVWAAPSNMDRVDGAWIAPLGQRDASAAQTAITELASLMTDAAAAPAVKVAWIEAVAKLGVKSQAGVILARLQGDPLAPVRVAALTALQKLGVPELEPGVRAAMADNDTTVRAAAIAALPEMAISAPAKVELLVSVVGGGSTAEQQSAILALGKVPGNEALQALERLADGLATGAVAAGVQLELLEAMLAGKAARLEQRVDRLKVARDLANLGTVFPQALTTGGSSQRGRQVTVQHAAAQCGRCHTAAGTTPAVGPNLAGVGARLSREQLLEALILPSARITPGYGQVTVTLKSGRKLEGTLLEESPTTIGIEDARQGVQRIPVADIATRSNAPSAMPPMHLLLTPRELRDVVEFLASQK